MLPFAASRVSMMASYLFLGALVGILLIHPLNLTVVWFELARFSETAPSFMEFMQARLWFMVLPRHMDVALAYAVIGALVGAAFGVFTRNYVTTAKAYQSLREEQTALIPDIIKRGESSKVEFKSSLRWDVNENRVNRGLEKVIAKTVAGFFNGEGGYLVIGVDDNGQVLGLAKDLTTLKQPNVDAFKRSVNDVVTKFLGGDLCPYIHTVFAKIGEDDVAMVIVRPAPRAVYMEEGKSSTFYVRSGNSTRQLDVREALNYASKRW
ncbi:putative DNA-binding protein [Roseibium hamelinense]|uniref:Putative DNA-binding protein n=1 Tax=Roseibium hamelinense TaxID=150831 RepID=A0A562SG72_9HYPH|nr:ATP-binding protein [Roseibium hamelinense]MTI42902.1 ATP-binding protein [Roseibium hamelinense]TWI79934.1 putative DNA-binding protein [Roseibium hamelinense]